MFNELLWNRLFLTVYGDEGAEGAVTGAGDPPATPPPTPPPTPTNQDTNPKTGKLFTQEEVNRIASENKRKLQEQVRQHVAELEQLKKSKSITDKERESLASRIEEMQNSMLTQEELKRKDSEKTRREYEAKIKEAESKINYFQELFFNTTMEREIQGHAAAAEAYNPTQIVNLLKQNARMAEVTDEEGNVISGQYVVKVKLKDKDANGKPVELDLEVPEALKRMKDDNEQWGNLFKSNLTSGLGDKRSEGSGKPIDVRKLSPEEYRKRRKEIL